MNAGKVMGVVVIILVVVIVVLIVLHTNLRREHNSQQERLQIKASTIELLQQDDIQAILFYVQQVMRGEIVYEHDSPEARYSWQWFYSFNSNSRRSWPDTNTIESSLTALEIDLDYDKGRGIITVAFSMRYLDSAGNMLRGISVAPASPAALILERQGDEWVVIGIDEFYGKLNWSPFLNG